MPPLMMQDAAIAINQIGELIKNIGEQIKVLGKLVEKHGPDICDMKMKVDELLKEFPEAQRRATETKQRVSRVSKRRRS